ncbi:TPA: hypothetical protein RQL24_003368 [Vibrio vulnificus]|nr:hypothetical protein [Vibrio vulnificus]HDY8080470.1 hypothetical protein [Vibrio vulnificus]HDY8191260.1 hypothetical protein [Vibrio vulnificus]
MKITHRPKGSMCANCKGLSSDHKQHQYPSREQFKRMPKIGKDSDGMIVVRCNNFDRV